MNNDIKKSLLNIELILASFGVDFNIDEEDMKYAFDENVNECQMFLYLSLMTNEDSPEYQECEDRFTKAYSKLNDDQKQYVKNDLIKIIKQQEQNRNDKER